MYSIGFHLYSYKLNTFSLLFIQIYLYSICYVYVQYFFFYVQQLSIDVQYFYFVFDISPFSFYIDISPFTVNVSALYSQGSGVTGRTSIYEKGKFTQELWIVTSIP